MKVDGNQRNLICSNLRAINLSHTGETDAGKNLKEDTRHFLPFSAHIFSPNTPNWIFSTHQQGTVTSNPFICQDNENSI